MNYFYTILVYISISLFAGLLKGQAPLIELGGALTGEYAQGGGHSSFYYNELVRGEGRLFLREANLTARLNLHPKWSFNSRGLLAENPIGQLNQLQLAQAELQYRSQNLKWTFSAGRFLLPFGHFFQQPLPQDRTFISRPLPYSYYIGISPYVGYSSELAESDIIPVDQIADWGLTNAYWWGYGTGIKGKWVIKPDTAQLEVAIVQAAPALGIGISQPTHPTIVIRAEVRPGYFWKQGLSISHGGFFQENMLNSPLQNLGAYSQTLIGTDWEFGYGHFQLTGELMYATYRVPQFIDSSATFVTDQNGSHLRLQLQNISGYMDLKYELPFWIGAYLAYRWEFMTFGEGPESISIPWDNAVQRHTLLWGYHITRFLVFKASYGWQNIDNRDWALNHLRISATVHF